MITIFKDYSDINNPNYITLEQCLERIKNGRSKEKIESIREKIRKGEDVSVEKKLLPFVVVSASKVVPKEKVSLKGLHYNTCRLDECVVEHSGYFVLDWDKCDTARKLEQLKADPYIHAAWLAPSANGVKAIVKCPPSTENHPLYYTAFLDRYPELDPTSRNISRGTFESWDPEIYFNRSSLVWERKMSEQDRRRNKEKTANRRGSQVLSTAVGMVRSSYDGNKHDTLRNAAVLVGGYVSTGRVDESQAKKVLIEEISSKGPKDLNGAIKTIEDGISFGKQRPLFEAKKLEKEQKFIRRQDGTYDFLADEEEMDEYELAVINGTLEMGLPTGIIPLNRHWMFKKHHIVWVAALDNVGKTFLVWYLAVLAAKQYDWKFLIHSAENNDGMIRKKLKEFLIGKSLKLMSRDELDRAHVFVKDHFRIISSKQFHTLEEFILKAEVIYDEGFQYEVLIAEPWNSFDVPKNADKYSNLIHSMNLLRVFKENYSSVWACDHVATTAARNKDKQTGFVIPPIKADVEMGQMKANKADDFLILHRLPNSPLEKNNLQIHVVKIKDIESGGLQTEKDNPVVITINSDYCGYNVNGMNPMKTFRL